MLGGQYKLLSSEFSYSLPIIRLSEVAEIFSLSKIVQVIKVFIARDTLSQPVNRNQIHQFKLRGE